MTLPRAITNYGGVFEDADVVGNPTKEQSADYANRLHEDVAQLTRAAPRAVVTFQPTTTAAPTTVVPTGGRSQMGTASGLLPTVAKTATGTYTLTYATSFVDALGQTEITSFFAGMADAWGSGVTGYAKVVNIVANVVTVEVRNSADALNDLSGTAFVSCFLW